MLLVWAQNLASRAVAWWGIAHLLRSLSIALYGLYGTVSDLISIDVAGATLFISYGATWTGARVFEGRPPRPGSIITGATLWLLACQIPGLLETTNVRGLVSSIIIGVFSWLAAYEFWRGRRESLISRWPVVLLLFFQGAVFMLRTPLSAFLPEHQGALSSAWLTVISPEALLLPISIAFVLVALVKERSELRQRVAAQIDSLTGLPNRRGFMQEAEGLIQARIRNGRSVAVFLLDLDNFKSINDKFGHATGDAVLGLFGEIARENLRPSDIVGRVGGEEFAVVLDHADRDNAILVAERLRSAFQAAAETVDGRILDATISIGISMTEDHSEDLAILLRKADQALYRAKAGGRNRIEILDTKVVHLSPVTNSASAAA
jgi:diguanylate cyclase (GGDEF)-like protein